MRSQNSQPHFELVETNGIRLRVALAGKGPLVVLVHGWPESWYSWRHQIPALVTAGYRVAAPDVRVELVHARASKRSRALPVAALYEQGRVSHAGAFTALQPFLWVPSQNGRLPVPLHTQRKTGLLSVASTRTGSIPVFGPKRRRR